MNTFPASLSCSYSGNGVDAVEVKNYNIGDSSEDLIAKTSDQINYRQTQLPAGSTQQVWIDVTGQAVTDQQTSYIAQQIAAKTNGLVPASKVIFFAQ